MRTTHVPAAPHVLRTDAHRVAPHTPHWGTARARPQRKRGCPAACECVHLASRGVPRLVNQICDYALVYAFTDGLEKVDAGVVEQVVADRKARGRLAATA